MATQELTAAPPRATKFDALLDWWGRRRIRKLEAEKLSLRLEAARRREREADAEAKATRKAKTADQRRETAKAAIRRHVVNVVYLLAVGFAFAGQVDVFAVAFHNTLSSGPNVTAVTEVSIAALVIAAGCAVMIEAAGLAVASLAYRAAESDVPARLFRVLTWAVAWSAAGVNLFGHYGTPLAVPFTFGSLVGLLVFELDTWITVRVKQRKVYDAKARQREAARRVKAERALAYAALRTAHGRKAATAHLAGLSDEAVSRLITETMSPEAALSRALSRHLSPRREPNRPGLMSRAVSLVSRNPKSSQPAKGSTGEPKREPTKPAQRKPSQPRREPVVSPADEAEAELRMWEFWTAERAQGNTPTGAQLATAGGVSPATGKRRRKEYLAREAAQ